MVIRRGFMKGSLAAGVAAAVPFSPVQGANDDIRVAVAGINGQGRGLIGEFRDIGGVRVVALCDVDGNVLEREVKKFKGRNEKVEGYGDYRRMLEDKSIDVVAIATPDHWHVPLAAWSVVAGKDMYVEKPLSHTISEGHYSAGLCHLANIAMRLGRRLRFDTKPERFIGDDQANGYLTKRYRKGYELPSL